MSSVVTSSRPFADASPAQIREVLLPEELPQFEAEYADALREAAETYSLDKLHQTMASWRRIAWMTDADPEAHRLMLQRAEYTLRTGGDVLPGSRLVPQEEMEARLQARLPPGRCTGSTRTRLS
ncbi:MAG: DUF6247 family protein [Pseudonocardiaceae bacterium]